MQAEIEQGRTIMAGARRARVPHLLFSSVAGANQHTGVPHFDNKALIEAELAATDVHFRVLHGNQELALHARDPQRRTIRTTAYNRRSS